MALRFVPVIPTQLILRTAHINGRITAVRQIIRKETNIHERMFNATTRTWSQKNKPDWKRRERFDGDDFTSTLSTRSVPFVYVERGTSIRFRVMTKDFSPKTRRGVLGSRLGSGGPAGWGVKPGIKARNFRREIAKRRASPLQKKLTSALRIQNVGFARLAGTPAETTASSVRAGFEGR